MVICPLGNLDFIRLSTLCSGSGNNKRLDFFYSETNWLQCSGIGWKSTKGILYRGHNVANSTARDISLSFSSRLSPPLCCTFVCVLPTDVWLLLWLTLPFQNHKDFAGHVYLTANTGTICTTPSTVRKQEVKPCSLFLIDKYRDCYFDYYYFFTFLNFLNFHESAQSHAGSAATWKTAYIVCSIIWGGRSMCVWVSIHLRSASTTGAG